MSDQVGNPKDCFSPIAALISFECVGTIHVVRYWSEGLCCTIMTHLEVKVIIMQTLKFYV